MPVGAAALVLAAAAGTFIAVIGYVGLCDNDSSACPEGHAEPALAWQLVLAVAGLPVAAATAWAVTRDRPEVVIVAAGVAAIRRSRRRRRSRPS